MVRGTMADDSIRRSALQRTAGGVATLLLAGSVCLWQRPCSAQISTVVQAQADAARSMIVVSVQQGISSLPPSSAQSFFYHFDYEAEVFVPDDRLGPTVFRSPEVLRRGDLNLRVGASYFEQSEDFAPISYLFDSSADDVDRYTRLGLNLSAKVGLVNFSLNYGLVDRIETRITVPVVIVDAKGATVLYVSKSEPDPISDQTPVVTGETPAIFSQAVANKQAVPKEGQFPQFGVESFNDGAQAGLGRIGLGAKAAILRGERFKLAFDTEFFLPSPNEAEFAGPDSPAILPRLIGAVDIAEWLRGYVDVGYDYDFDQAVLRRFAWDIGLSVPYSRFAFDLGVGGSEYAESIEWTPDVAPPTETGQLFLTPGEDNSLGTTFVDVLLGIKVKVWQRVAFSGAVTIPVDDREFRPAALGTVALEVAF